MRQYRYSFETCEKTLKITMQPKASSSGIRADVTVALERRDQVYFIPHSVEWNMLLINYHQTLPPSISVESSSLVHNS